MKATGMVRKVDELGRVVLPIELRRTMNIEEKDPMEIYVDGNDIILRKYNPGCQVQGCGAATDLITLGGVTICKSCAGALLKKYRN